MGVAGVRRVTAAAVLRTAAAALALAACDVAPVAETILDVGPPPPPFTVASAEVDGEGDGTVALTFTQAVDPRTIGPRSLRVLRADGRRVVHSSFEVDGATVRIRPEPARGLPRTEDLRLRVAGGASPRAVRSLEGAALDDAFELALRAPAGGVADLEGPAVVGSQPADGARDVVPGTSIELRFSEPISAGAVRSGDAVTVSVDGVAVAVRARLSADRRRVLVRPDTSIPPGAAVGVEVHPCVLDRAGNPLREGSARRMRFRTRDSTLHEIVEDFVCDDMSDPAATDCAWGEPGSPGFLVPRCGATPAGSAAPAPDTDLGDRPEIRFLLHVRAGDVPGGVATGIRLRFATTSDRGPLLAAVVDGGVFGLEALDPSFEGSRRNADLAPLAHAAGPFAWEVEGAGAVVDVPFAEPLRLSGADDLLFDVRLRVTPGSRLAAGADDERRTLVEDGGRVRLAPAAAVLVAAGSPRAGSRWYDTGVARPDWGTAQVLTDVGDPGVRIVAEYQSAPGDAAGAPDDGLASPWERDLSRLPSQRFVRFRLQFDGAASGAAPPRVDRVVLPYVVAGSDAR